MINKGNTGKVIHELYLLSSHPPFILYLTKESPVGHHITLRENVIKSGMPSSTQTKLNFRMCSCTKKDWNEAITISFSLSDKCRVPFFVKLKEAQDKICFMFGMH